MDRTRSLTSVVVQKLLSIIKTASLMFFVSFLTLAAHAEENSKGEGLLKALSYPELEVVPRASQRLRTEAIYENKNAWKTHLSLQVSALSTLVAGVVAIDSPKKDASQAERDNNEWSSQLGILVGGGWLATTLVMSGSYKPYRSAWLKVKKMPKGSQAEELARERTAEEGLYTPARLGTRLKYLSIVTNALASAYIIGNGSDEVKVAGSLSLLLALNPLIFDYRWGWVADQHREYKKKIYGPVAQFRALPKANGEMDFAPTLAWHLNF
jgi:hypothetical protein